MLEGAARLIALKETVQIINQRGLHARASAKFVNMVSLLPEGLDVRVSKEGSEAAGGSILGLMMLGAAKGDTIDISVSGSGAEEALLKLAGLVKDGFGED
jgi:phosphocarrier protein HPr